MKEQELIRQIMDYLQFKHYFHWRNNTGAVANEYKGHRYFFRFGALGSPDIFILKDGKLIGVEAKANKNKQSEAQKAFQENMEKNGGIYILCYSLDDLLKI